MPREPSDRKRPEAGGSPQHSKRLIVLGLFVLGTLIVLGVFWAIRVWTM